MYDATRDTPRRGPLTQTYFAYGSNLDAAQMRARCPSAKLLGAAILDGYRLGFAGQSAAWGGGVATVVRDGDENVGIGSSTVMCGIGSGFSGSVIVSPIMMSSMPARQMMSPAAAFSTSTRLRPSNMYSFVTFVL